MAATASGWIAAGWVSSEDRNRDGRPDLWRCYDASGELTRVATDTNFDGRSDQQDYYDHGVLIRRERDRNLDDRVDLIETFDPTGHLQTRAVVDVDFSGTADLLVLFRDGHPAVSEWLPEGAGTAAASREPNAPPTRLADPSRHQAAMTGADPHVAAGSVVAMASTTGLPEPRFALGVVIARPRTGPTRLQVLHARRRSPHGLRGPPAVSVV